MRRLLPLLMVLSLGACAQARAFLTSNPEVSIGGAVLAEQRVGTACAVAKAAGNPIDVARVVRLEYARIGADALLFRDMRPEARSPVDIARALTDRLCADDNAPVIVAGPGIVPRVVPPSE